MQHIMRDKVNRHSIQTAETSNADIRKSKSLPLEIKKPNRASSQAEMRSRLRVSDILEALPFYVMLIDDKHYIVQANSAVAKQFGIKTNGIIGKYCPKVLHGLDEPWYACPLEEAAEKDQAVEREAFDQQSGRWFRSAVYPVKRYPRQGKKIFLHMVSDITDRKQAEEDLRNSREQLRNLSAHLESIREKERANLAREIHDELGQILTGLKIDLNSMSKRLPEKSESALEKARSMSELIDSAIQTVKKIVTDLRPGVLDDLGLAAAIEWQAQEMEKRTGIKFDFISSPEEIVLDRERSTAIFRICQEALTNIVRHAEATSVKISLKKQGGRIILRVSDNGKGITAQQISDPRAFGLIGMRERACFWGGEIKINTLKSKGTTVTVNIPLAGCEDLDAEDTDRG